MVIDAELLRKARAAGDALTAADRAAMLARAEYNTVVRRLHLGGASLREIAGELGVSHQRVQQIVDAAGGTWWRPRKRDAVCTFCERPPSEVSKLVSGPNVYICDGCIERSEAALSGRREASAGPRSALTLARTGKAECSFCGKRRGADRPLVLGPTSNVCAPCVELCRKIIDDSGEGVAAPR